MATGSLKPAAESSTQSTLLSDAIKKVEGNVDTKLSAIKQDHTTECKSADDRLFKKLPLDSKLTFKKKGNKKIIRLHEQVQDKLVDSVTSGLDQTLPAVEKAETLIKEDDKLIDVQQKHIK